MGLTMSKKIAALYVQRDGVYSDLEGVSPWPEERDARSYRGPHPVVAHPPCARWGKFWYGSPSGKTRYEKGDDGGCFANALACVRHYCGVIEHPAESYAWTRFDLPKPVKGAGWSAPDNFGGRSIYVEQGQYGHVSRKPTWLYAVGIDFDIPIDTTVGEQRLRHRDGYERDRRRGIVHYQSKKQRAATPIPFRDLLINLARSV